MTALRHELAVGICLVSGLIACAPGEPPTGTGTNTESETGDGDTDWFGNDPGETPAILGDVP